MTFYFGLTKYLLLCAFVDRAFLVPVPAYANLLNLESSFGSMIEDQNNQNRDVLPYGKINAYLPLLLDEVEISKYREEALNKYYGEKRQFKRENNRKEIKDQTAARYSQEIGQRAYKIHTSNDEFKSILTKNQKDSDKQTHFISVPFKAVFTITQDNVPEPTRRSFGETRDPQDKFSLRDKEHSRREIAEKPEFSTKPKDTSQKRRFAGLGDMLRMLRLKIKKKNSNQLKETNIEPTNFKPEKPAEEITLSPIIVFEDEPPRPRSNETSQRQELADDEEDSAGSLGSITDILPLVLPILQELSDPNSGTDLGEVLGAAIPFLEGFLGGIDISNIIGMIGPVLARILGNADGGIDIFATLGPLIGPLLQAAGPLIGPVGGPIISAVLNTLRSPDAVSSIVKSLVNSLIEPGPDGNTPLLTATTDILTSVIKDLRPGEPGGLDVAAIVEAFTAGTISGTIAAFESSAGKGEHQPYGPYGPYGTAQGPVEAGSDHILRTSPEFVVSRQRTNSFQQRNPSNPAKIVGHHTIRDHTNRRPYVNAPQKIHPAPLPPLQHFVNHHATGLVQAGTTNTGSGGSSYVSDGNIGVPAYSVNPLDHIISSVKDFVGDGVQLFSPGPVQSASDRRGSSYSPYGNHGTPAYGANKFGIILSSIKNVVGDGIQLLSTVINAVFGISGASSADHHQGSYGPPTKGTYGPPP